MVYGYIRVSTEAQTVENQRLAITKYCTSHGVEIDDWVAETISGTVPFKKRKLGLLFQKLQPGDTLYITEISRLERNVFSVFNMVLFLLKKGILVYSILEDLWIKDDSDSAMKIFSTAYAAQVEREKIVQRTKLGLQRAIAQGKHPGRCKGQKPIHYKLDKYKDFILSALSQNKSLLNISRSVGTSWSTIHAWCKRNNVKTLTLTERRSMGLKNCRKGKSVSVL